MIYVTINRIEQKKIEKKNKNWKQCSKWTNLIY